MYYVVIFFKLYFTSQIIVSYLLLFQLFAYEKQRGW